MNDNVLTVIGLLFMLIAGIIAAYGLYLFDGRLLAFATIGFVVGIVFAFRSVVGL